MRTIELFKPYNSIILIRRLGIIGPMLQQLQFSLGLFSRQRALQRLDRSPRPELQAIYSEDERSGAGRYQLEDQSSSWNQFYHHVQVGLSQPL